jgi:hypothetical protein
VSEATEIREFVTEISWSRARRTEIVEPARSVAAIAARQRASVSGVCDNSPGVCGKNGNSAGGSLGLR